MAEAISVEITGVKELTASINKLASDLQDLTDANKEIGSDIAQKASARAPRLTGALSASIGSTATKDKAEIYAGNNAVVYAGVQEYGWPEQNIQAQPFLRPAVYENIQYIVNKYEDTVKRRIEKYNLN